MQKGKENIGSILDGVGRVEGLENLNNLAFFLLESLELVSELLCRRAIKSLELLLLASENRVDKALKCFKRG